MRSLPRETWNILSGIWQLKLQILAPFAVGREKPEKRRHVTKIGTEMTLIGNLATTWFR
jgi:hypothetical protein